MSAAPECIPAAVGEISQRFPMTQCPRPCKEEVLDPGYSNSITSTPNGLAVDSSSSALPISASASGATAASAVNPAIEKVKRSYTRKPNGGSKAKKIKTEPEASIDTNGVSSSGATQSQIGDHMPVQKKKRDRFKGTTEEEVLKRVLPDHIRDDLDILIVGINPGLTAAYVQHHYAGPGNHFWKCLYLSGIIPEPMNALQDAELLNYGIGFTNIVARTTRGSADLTRKEIFEGGEILKEKMLKYLPKIALFNGKGIYEVFCGHKKFHFGLQPDPFPGCPDTCVFVNPSSSARCTQLPRAVDKVPFYEALKRVRDHIRVHGSVNGIDRSTVTFPDFKLVTAPQKVKTEVKKEPTEMAEGDKPSTASAMPQTTSEPTKAVKPKKPRGRPKREKPVNVGNSNNPAPVLNEASNSNQLAPQQGVVNSNGLQQPGAFQPNSTDQLQHNNATGLRSTTGPLASAGQLGISGPRGATGSLGPTAQLDSDFAVKREVVDAAHHDKDLAAIIQQSINAQQSMFHQQQQHSIAAATSIPHSMNGTNPGLGMPPSSTSAVKQERHDWNGYGVMPGYAPGTPTSMAAYPQYSCYWGYLPTTSSFMTNGFSGIPAPQIAHQQAVAAAAALHTSVAASQANVSAPAPAAVSYNSPQEASSPAMSSQSNLTQASLDSLPKADSASTVANWLQSIPHS